MNSINILIIHLYIDKYKSLKIKIENPNASVKELDNLCIGPANFLFDNYTVIYNKLIRNQIDIHMLYVFLDKLKEIENGKLSQQEAAYDIGMILRKMYVDPRLEPPKEPEYVIGKKISWNEYKENQYLNN